MTHMKDTFEFPPGGTASRYPRVFIRTVDEEAPVDPSISHIAVLSVFRY